MKNNFFFIIGKPVNVSMPSFFDFSIIICFIRIRQIFAFLVGVFCWKVDFSKYFIGIKMPVLLFKPIFI